MDHRPRQADLYLEWRGFYADCQDAPQVVVEKGSVVDANLLARDAGALIGMRLQHVLPLLPGCLVKQFGSDTSRREAWLDLVVPFSDVIEPLADHVALVDLGGHPDPIDISRRIVARLLGRGFGELSYGLGGCGWLADLGSRQNRHFDYHTDAAGSLGGQPVDVLLCLSESERERLKSLGLGLVRQVREVRMSVLRRQFGDRALMVSLAAEGRGGRRVRSSYPSDAVAETTWFFDPVNCERSLMLEIDQISERLAIKSAGKQAGRARVRVESDGGEERSVVRAYKRPVSSFDRIRASLRFLAQGLLAGATDVVRLTAHLEGLEPVRSSQTSFFTLGGCGLPDAAVVGLQSSLGAKSIVLASEVELPRRSQVLKVWRDATGWN